jgi:hypothetical protein
LSHASSLFYSDYFGHGGLRNYLGCTLTTVLLISVCQEARIAGVSHHTWS